MLLEYGPPLTASVGGRDTGRVHPVSGEASYVVVELNSGPRPTPRTATHCGAACPRTAICTTRPGAVVLLDEQRLAYETVMAAVRKARRSNLKQVVVVTGGPGSGKSVIAPSLLGDLWRRGAPALHATGSQSFTKTVRKVAGVRKPEVQRLFRYFNSFAAAEPDDVEVLVRDEAHPGRARRRTAESARRAISTRSSERRPAPPPTHAERHAA
ncbi:DNA/RNA helicase domain-containing protein [Streptomyces sp. 2132.2]|uniref:DNA/RNA helicase domain-containing protein n=1 Tax=Streptomyces sp. 2132.2 TaxID=2485161 RepID=UPI0037D9C708